MQVDIPQTLIGQVRVRVTSNLHLNDENVIEYTPDDEYTAVTAVYPRPAVEQIGVRVVARAGARSAHAVQA